MNAETIMTIAAIVVGLTQLVKWAKLPDNYGPLAVLVFALAAVVFWGWTHDALTKALAFDLFNAWVTISMSAAGVFGFTRAGAGAVVRIASPPESGAGSSPTTKAASGNAGAGAGVKLRV